MNPKRMNNIAVMKLARDIKYHYLVKVSLFTFYIPVLFEINITVWRLYLDTDPYLSSGVDQSKADNLSHWISKSLQKNSNNLSTPLGHQMNEIGGFAGFFKPNLSSFKEPLLVSSTDGVGSKLLLALQTGTLEQIGIDLVAMCVNDLYTVGAQPLFFLDYFATGTLSAENFKKVLAGIQKGLNECDTVLLGGETAQLPGLYQKDHFDLAGFVVFNLQ